MLTDQQLNFFNLFGYLAFPGIFAADIDAISEAFDSVFDDPGQFRMDSDSSPYVPGPREVIPAIVNQHPALAELQHDARILDVANGLLPHGHLFLPGDGSRFRSETTWHMDAVPKADSGLLHLKMALYLDSLDEDSGALRVIPGSHHDNDAYAAQLRRLLMRESVPVESTLGVPADTVACSILNSTPGDLLVWNRRIAHCSFNGSSRCRRVISFGFKALPS